MTDSIAWSTATSKNRVRPSTYRRRTGARPVREGTPSNWAIRAAAVASPVGEDGRSVPARMAATTAAV